MSLTESQETNIILLYNKKITIRKIEELTGNSQSTIERVIKKAKVKKRGAHCLRINRAKCKNLPTDYMSGKFSIKDLLKKYGIKSDQTLYRILDEFKVPRIKPNQK